MDINNYNNVKCQSSNPKTPNPNKVYNIQERTVKFSQDIIDFSRRLSNNLITRPMIVQLVMSGTSVGANCAEADEASSRKNFINKITIAKKEVKETKYWLRLIIHSIPHSKRDAKNLWQEAQELNLILAAIVRSAKSKK